MYPITSVVIKNFPADTESNRFNRLFYIILRYRLLYALIIDAEGSNNDVISIKIINYSRHLVPFDNGVLVFSLARAIFSSVAYSLKRNQRLVGGHKIVVSVGMVSDNGYR